MASPTAKLDALVNLQKAKTYAERSAALSSARKCDPKDLDNLLVELASGTTYEALLAVKVSAAAQTSAAQQLLLQLVAHSSPHVMCAAARATVQTVRDDSAIREKFSSLTPAAQRRLLAQLRGRRGPEKKHRASLAEKLLPLAREFHGPAAAAALRKVAIPADGDASIIEPAEKAYVKWHVLALSKPGMVAKHLFASVAIAKPWAVEDVLAAVNPKVWAALARSKDKTPIMELLTSPFAGKLPATALCSMQPLLKKHAEILGPLLIGQARRGSCLPPWLLRRNNLRHLPSGSVEEIGRVSTQLCCMVLRSLPPGDQAQFIKSVQPEVSLDEQRACSIRFLMHYKEDIFADEDTDHQNFALLYRLRGDARAEEVRRLLSKPKCTGKVRLQVLCFLPFAEAAEELKVACRVPDEDERAERVALLIKCAMLSDDAAPALKWMLEKMRTERPNVRLAALKALQSIAMRGVLKEQDIPLLRQAFLHSNANQPDEEMKTWKAIALHSLKNAMKNSALDAPLTEWALSALVEAAGDWDGLIQPIFLHGSPCDVLLKLFSNEGKVAIISDASLKWAWETVATPVLAAAKRLAAESPAEGCSGGKGFGKCGKMDGDTVNYSAVVLSLAEHFASGPRKLLFRSDALRPLLQECKDMLISEDFLVVDAATIKGNKSGKGIDQKPPAITKEQRMRVFSLMLNAAETRDEAVKVLEQQPHLLPELATGWSARNDDRKRQGSPVTRLLSTRPHILVSALLAQAPSPVIDDQDDEDGKQNGEDGWLKGSKPPPLCRAATFARWLPEQQAEFHRKWLSPILNGPNELPASTMIGSLRVQPRSSGMWAAVMMARLTFCDAVIPELLEKCSKSVSNAADLQKKIKAADEAAVKGETVESSCASGKGMKGKKGKDNTKEDSDTAKLALEEAFVQNLSIALSRSLQAPGSTLSALMKAMILGGESGKTVVKALRRASSFVPSGQGVEEIVGLLAREDLSGIGVRKELLRSLADQPRVLCAQWDEKAHRDVRCAIVQVAASMAGSASQALELLHKAAASVAASEPFENNGSFVAKALVKATEHVTQLSVPHVHQGAFVSRVLGELLHLRPVSGRAAVRLEVLEALKRIVAFSARSGDAAKLLPLIAAEARDLALETEATWEELRGTSDLLVKCAWGAPDVPFTCVKTLKEGGEHGARLVYLMLMSFRSLPASQRSSCSSVLSQIAGLLNEVPLQRMSLAFSLEALPWLDASVLPTMLLDLTSATPEFLVEDLYRELVTTLRALPNDEDKQRSMEKAAVLLQTGNRLAKAAACALAVSLAAASKNINASGSFSGKGKGKGKGTGRVDASTAGGYTWDGYPGELLGILKKDEDESIRTRAFWIGMRLDNFNSFGEEEECGLGEA